MLRELYYFYCNVWNFLQFHRKHVKKGKNVKIFGRLRVCGSGQLEIKENARVVSDWRANPIGGEYTVFNLIGGANHCWGKFRII